MSPCDAVVGACGRVDDEVLIQAKGLPYTLEDLLGDDALAARHRNGHFVTLRLSSTMYHRFHAPAACRVREVTHIAGDTWNVNPIALKRVERLFCRNERAVLPLELEELDGALTLVPVAAIGVASLRLHCLGATLGLRYAGPTRIACDARYEKGQELGWFEQGSTIIVLASGDFALADGVSEGRTLRFGEPLLVTSKWTRGDEHDDGDDDHDGKAFRDALREQRWDDHRFYHHSRINQSLHLFSACCFLTSYALLVLDPTKAVWIGWIGAWISRQIGHFFFEPKGYDAGNAMTHQQKEDVKIGYNLPRKVMLFCVFLAAPLVLYLDPTSSG